MELARFPSRGGFSVRSIITFVLAVLTTVIFWAIFSGAPAHAADATWNGAAIKYDGNQYASAGKIQKDDGTGLPVDSPYYVYVETPQVTGTSGQTMQKAHIIYFTPGTDPPTASSASYVTFDYDASATKKFSHPSDQKTISLDTTTANSGGSSCAVSGVGWFVCPVMNNILAPAMDYIFGIIAGFMKVQPLQTGNTDGGLYIAWNIMRSIANIAFIIAFIIIIYSQLTNVEINNYGLKKLLPRIIIAALAINLSYIICAIGVDLSNILGYTLQDVFNGIRDQIVATGTPTGGAELLSWQSITGFVLSGGTAALAVGVGTAAAIAGTGGTVAGAVFLLLPVLMGLLLAILVVLLILAARQALIVILVVIAPLALVAYLLPNTEKWFKKWRELFMTMLIFFPAFSVVFGGSQLAAAIIVKNATSINMVILGMIVQVAPLVITPLLLKFSGSLLGSIAKIANNPNKGILDRTRNWSKSHADWHRQRGTGNLKMNGDPRKRDLSKANFMRSSARYMDQRKKRLADRTTNAGVATQNAYEESGLYSKTTRKGTHKYDMAIQKAYFEDEKSGIHDRHAEHVNKARRTQGSLIYDTAMDARASKAAADASQARTDTFYNNVLKNERFANRVGGSALFNSGYNLEAAKSRLEASESLKTDFYQTQRATQGTRLHAASVSVENSKLRAEGSQNAYNAMVEDLKATSLSQVTLKAQSNKEALEGAQARLQAFFDQERLEGGRLNISHQNLERSKSKAEIAQNDLTTYIARERSQPGGNLRTVQVELERAKQVKGIAEDQLAAQAENLKTGKIDLSTLTTQQQAIMQEMAADSNRALATKRSIVSAQFEVQSNFAQAMTGTGPETEELLDIAQGVGGVNARSRAQADAVKSARQLESTELTNSLELLKADAARNKSNLKRYSLGIVEAAIAGEPMYEGIYITPERFKAALAAQAEEKNMSLFEEVSGSTTISQNFGQAVVNEIIDIYRTNFKVAGGFARQDNPNLNIDNYASEKEFKHALRVARISNLANANASGISNLKFGWVANSLAEQEELKANLFATLTEARRDQKENPTDEDIRAATGARASLQGAFNTVRLALSNPDTLVDFTDREAYIREIEAVLATMFGVAPLEKPKLNLDVTPENFEEMFNRAYAKAASAEQDENAAENVAPEDDAPNETGEAPGESDT